MSGKFVVLNDDYVIRGSESEQVLQNLRDGARYELSREQFDFLTQFKGGQTFEEIRSQYDSGSQAVINDFVANLQTIGALSFSEKKVNRVLPPGVVPDIWLEAVHLENSSACNLRCCHCYQGNKYPVESNLTFEEVRRVADEMLALQVMGVSLSGGEPFLQPDLFDIVRLFEEREIRIISIFTNGILLSREMTDKILAGKSQPAVFVSLDAITPEGMIFRGLEPVAGRQALEKILANILMLREKGLRVVVNTVMNAGNIMLLGKMYDVVRELSVSSWRIGYPKQTGFFRQGKDEFGLSWETMAQASFALLQRHFRLGRPFHLQMEYLYREELFRDFQSIPEDAYVCDYERKRQSVCIKPNGDVVSCAYCTDFPAGNIRQQSLGNIWYSKEMQRIKEVRIKDVKDCQGCELRPYCATGCRANAYFLNGDFYHSKDDYACQAVRFFVDSVLPFLKGEGAIK